MIYRELKIEESDEFLEFLLKLDQETETMLLEVGERDSNREVFRKELEERLKNSFVCVAKEKNKIVGYISGDRLVYRRIKHSVYVVIGVFKSKRGRGIGKRLFEELINWSKENRVKRMELTVLEKNINAIKLYEKLGFEKEGLQRRGLLIDGQYENQYYMGKLL